MEKFPKAFLLGAATAAHQVEGNNIYSDASRRGHWCAAHSGRGRCGIGS